jgi:hypothetical protein
VVLRDLGPGFLRQRHKGRHPAWKWRVGPGPHGRAGASSLPGKEVEVARPERC